MNYNDFDIIKVIKPFKYSINGEERELTIGMKGTIVESYVGEFLVEFLDSNEDNFYVLIDESFILKVWDSKTSKYV